MAGTKLGGQKAKETNKKKYGDNFYQNIGQLGGKARVPKGFALMDKDRLSAVSKKGGSVKGDDYKKQGDIIREWGE